MMALFVWHVDVLQLVIVGLVVLAFVCMVASEWLGARRARKARKRE